MQTYREPNRADWRRTALRLGAFAVLVIALLVLLRLPDGIAIWTALVVGGLVFLVRWHARSFAYECRTCGNVFTIGALQDFLGPQSPTWGGGGTKFLRCPRCGVRGWARIVVPEKPS